MSYEERLAYQDDAYRNAPMAGSRELPPDGEYQCVVDRFDVFEGKTDGKLYLRIEMSVAVGEKQGWPISKLHSLEDPKRFGFLKADLDVLGVMPESLADLQEALHGALDVPVLLAVKTKGDYRNVYLNQRLGGPIRGDLPVPEGFAPRQTVPTTADEDLPF